MDEKYVFYEKPLYRHDFDLKTLCDDFRNFACSNMGLFYEVKTIRLMFAGLASTKMILLQGISGTGKTSLPYAMGKYFLNDATMRFRSAFLARPHGTFRLLQRIYKAIQRNGRFEAHLRSFL